MKQKLLKIYFNLIWRCAKKYISKTNPLVVWITWSVGKTSARMIIYQVLKKQLSNKSIYTSSKNFNWELGLPFSIFKIDSYNPWIWWLVTSFFSVFLKTLFSKPDYDIVLLEYWIDHIWEMDFMLNIVKPDFSIVTKIDKVHCLNLWSPDITAEEKYKLAYAAKKAVFLNKDDSYSSGFQLSLDDELLVDKFYYNTTWNKSSDIDFSYYKIISDDWIFANFNLKIKHSNLNLKTNLIWKENAGYIWIWLAIWDIISQSKTFSDNMELNFDLQEWRFSFFDWIKDNIIIDSSYNSAPESTKKVIENVINIKESLYPKYKLVFVLWDMRELWEFSETEHRKIAWFISSCADIIYLLWDSMWSYAYDELLKIWYPKDKVYHFLDNKKLWSSLKKYLEDSDDKHIILFKWSQNTIFLEESVKYVLKDKSDFSKLPRQSNHWLKTKEN